MIVRANGQQRQNEDDLLLAVARGDARALKELYRAFERPLYTLGMRWLGDAQLAEELVQEVTLRIWRRAENFDPRRGAAGSWIFGIARNVAADLARAQARRPVPQEDVAGEPPEPWDEDRAWEGWQAAKALRALPPKQREVVVLACVEQMTQSEIARALGIPLGTVKTRLYHGLRALRAELAGLGVVDETDRV